MTATRLTLIIKRLKTDALSATENIKINRLIGFAGVALGLLLTLRHIDGINGTTPIIICLYLLAAISVGTISVKAKEKVAVNYPLLLFFSACALSLLIGRPEPLKYCWLRLAGFTIALAAISPAVSSPSFSILRTGIWRGWWIGAIILTGISFFVLVVAAITSRTADFDYFGFRGIMVLGMSLSPIAALTAIYSLYSFLNALVGRKRRIALLALYCAATITAIAGGSRIAIVGLIVGSAIILAFSWRKGQRTLSLSLLGVVLAIGAVSIASPAINSSIKYKASLAIDAGNPFSSRLDKWEGRLTEFQSAPFAGIGFSAQTVFNSPYDNEEKILSGNSPEPGSSWLSLLAQTGIPGTGMFLMFLIPVSINLLRDPHPLMLAVFTFLLLNGCCEGWLLYSSAILFPLFWLSTTLIEAKNDNAI